MRRVCGLRVRSIAVMTIFIMLPLSFVPRIEAAFLPSDASFPSVSRLSDLETVRKALEHKAVSERLKDLGFSEAEINQRVSELTDEDLHYLATRIDTLAPGGSTLGTIFAILLVILMVLGIMHLMGKRIFIR